MAQDFLSRLCEAVLAQNIVTQPEQKALIARAIADTLAVAAAGFPEQVTRNVLKAYGGSAVPAWSGEMCESAEASVMVNAIAAHALDFDDVYLESMAHISTVLLPAVLREKDDAPDAVIEAFAAGLIAAKAIARRVGQGHYRKGWHGTGTIGAFAAAAAVGRLEGLSHDQMADAIALAASMSGGLQANFSTQAKPAHAGFAAAAGTRAVRLAKAGVNGSRDIFGPRGYAYLYGMGDGIENPVDEAFELRPDQISVKLYPCCYATHRIVGVALDARAALGDTILDPSARYALTMPQGSISILKYDRPQNGLEAKFSVPYPLVAALADGVPTLASFEDERVRSEAMRALVERVDVTEDPAQPSGGDIEFGEVKLAIVRPGAPDAVFSRTALPGSPQDPPQPDALRAKLSNCLDIFANWAGRPFPISERAKALGIEPWL